MSIGTVFHKVVDGVHHLFVGGEHAVEQVKLFVEARPGLQADVNAFLGPIKDDVMNALTAEKDKLLAGGITDLVPELKKAVPTVASAVVSTFQGQLHHAGNANLLVSIAMAAAEAAFGL